MGILAYMQRIGRSLMVPVAVLPAAAILIGIGNWINGMPWGSGSIIATFLTQSGANIVCNWCGLRYV